MFAISALRAVRATFVVVPRVLPSSARTFTFLSTSRPTVLGFQAARANVLPAVDAQAVDVMPRITESVVLRGMQVRCGPRDTFNPSHLVRKRRHGFLSRLRTRKGRATLKRRMAKGRRFLSH